MGPDRAPVWPEGLTGSISHTATACVAAIGLRRDWAGIGVDLEDATPLDPLLVAEICTTAEQHWLGTQPASERGLMAKLIFSAKEATYKAQYPLSGQLFGFDVLELTLDRTTCRFNARFKTAQGPFAVGAVLGGAYVQAASGELAVW
jgi:4'-phosphopantetheinyl transferase EntD